jgi:hypothetical protein
MTLMIDNPVVDDADVDEYATPRFAPEHYGCPPWCTVNVRVDGESYVGHDSADGMPDKPGFDGYRHWTALYVPYQAAWEGASWAERRSGIANPLVVHLNIGATGSPVIAIAGADGERWTEFTPCEAAELGDEIRRTVAAYGPSRCPAWCQDEHRNPAGDNEHYAHMGVSYASAPVDELGQTGIYGVSLVQPAPEILLCGGEGMARDEIRLTIREAEQVAAAITELVGAAREGRAVA